MSEGEFGRESRREGTSVDPAQFRELVEQMARADTTIEVLVNRTNTLVRMLDLLNQRVARLEAGA